MDKFLRKLFSMPMMATGMIVFFVAIGAATFVESIYDTQTAKLYIYNAAWFNILLLYLCLNLIANVARYRMIQQKKWAVLTFHLAFIVILIGAGFTRLIGFEGMMLVREGEQSNFIYSSAPYLWFKANDGKLQYTNDRQIYLSEADSWNDFEISFDFPGHESEVSVEYVDFQKKMIDSLVTNDSIQETTLEFVLAGQSHYVSEGNFLIWKDLAVSYEKEDAMPGIQLFKDGNRILMKTKLPVTALPMSVLRTMDKQNPDIADSLYEQVPMDTLVPLNQATLYDANGIQFVYKDLKKNTRMMRMPSGKRKVGDDYLTVKVTDGEDSKLVTLKGGEGVIPTREVFNFKGLTYEMDYGVKQINLPFSIKCNDFQLDRYPGSNTPSSFASEVSIIDNERGYTRDQRIFMNNVMDYRGYRFFQSSYDEDEKGTRLSVNYDFWGTWITYVGYALMALGMILTLISKNSRFMELFGKVKKSKMAQGSKSVITVMALFASTLSFATPEAGEDTAQDSILKLEELHDHSGHDHSHEGHNHDHSNEPPVATNQNQQRVKNPIHFVMSEEHSNELASLLVQDFQGRIIPMHTLCDRLLRKVNRSKKYGDYNAVQTVVSMHMYPDYWMGEDVIYIPTKGGLRDVFDAKDGYVSYLELTNEQGEFKELEEYRKAHQMLESKRGEYEKKLIKVVERYQVMQSIFAWQNMKILPLKGEENNTWFVPLTKELMEKDTVSTRLALNYFTSIDKGARNNSFGGALDNLNELKELQYRIAGDVAPSKKKVAMEVSYNKMNIFSNVAMSYLLIGFVLLLVFFVKVFLPKSEGVAKLYKYIYLAFGILLGVIFLYHGYGLYMRAVISGHAPWSNGYEAVVFIAWVTIIFGFLFGRKIRVILAGAAILAFFMMFVTEMNLMDPEITPLQPVLKSYWLMIHVAIITGSYAPLGMACILGILNLLFYCIRTKKNGKEITEIIKTLSHVSEMIMTIGVFMLTIGTFLGGIWANESWGRYWGWDPKETWALVAILVYAIILHLRYIPGLKGTFLFNSVSMWGYTSILFTFFGVNFYLVGLHSYAQGDGLGTIPSGIIITAIIFVLFNVLAYIRYRKYKRELI